jgi:hypothetical protein
MSGDLVSPPRTRNTRMPQRINDIIMRAMAPDVAARYQRAGELLEDLLRATDRTPARLTAERPAQPPAAPRTDPAPAPWPRPRDTPPQPRFCWNCRKPLHARSDRCPFCGEAQ